MGWPLSSLVVRVCLMLALALYLSIYTCQQGIPVWLWGGMHQHTDTLVAPEATLTPPAVYGIDCKFSLPLG